MQDRVDDPYREHLIHILTQIKTLVETRADQTADLAQRFYIDALTDLLDKTCKHIPKLFTKLRTFQKESLAYALVENYELIHLNHERRLTFATGLAKGAPLTVAAIAQFYRSNASRREQVTCQHAIFLYNDGLYHYDCGVPNRPVLTEITLDYNYAPLALNEEQLVEAKKIRLDAYRKLKAEAKSLLQDRIHWATLDARECMEILRIPRVTKNYALRHHNINLLAAFLPGIIRLLGDAQREWRDAKKIAVGQGAQGAFLLIAGIAVQTAMATLFRSLFSSTPVVLANILIVMKFALILGTLFLAASLGFALYCYVQENTYRRMAMDIAQVNYAKEYPSPRGVFHRDIRYEVNKPLATFFQDHRPALDPAFLPALAL